MKIVSRIYGGLGNQLFQYVAAYYFSKYINATLYVDCTSGFKIHNSTKREYELNKFNLKINYYLPKWYENKFHRKYTIFIRKQNYIFENHNPNLLLDFDRSNKIFKNKEIYIDGYWQSFKYFEQIKDELKDNLLPINSSNLQLIGDNINKNFYNTIALHLRWFENNAKFFELDVGKIYLRNAIRYFREINSDPFFIVFTDNIFKSLDYLKDFDINYKFSTDYFDSRDAVIDLYLISKIKYKILSPSTFSWWAGTLTSDINSEIIAPSPEIISGKIWTFEMRNHLFKYI